MVRALIVTPNYKGTSLQLNATHKDGKAWRDFLLARSVPEASIQWLTEENLTGVTGVPTQANILQAMSELVSSEERFLIFFYAGHGTQVSDNGSEEEDGLDECIVPSDVKYIRDDLLKQTLIDPLRSDQKLLCVFDCCHSQTMLDLSTIVDYDPRNNSLVLSATAQVLSFAAQQTTETVTVQKTSPLIYAAPIIGVAGVRAKSTVMTVVAALVALVALVASRPRTTVRTLARPPVPRGSGASAKVMCLSACRDSQYAYESATNGFFTELLLPIVQGANATLGDIMLGTGQALVGRGVQQHPSVSLLGETSSKLEDLVMIQLGGFFA